MMEVRPHQSNKPSASRQALVRHQTSTNRYTREVRKCTSSFKALGTGRLACSWEETLIGESGSLSRDPYGEKAFPKWNSSKSSLSPFPLSRPRIGNPKVSISLTLGKYFLSLSRVIGIRPSGVWGGISKLQPQSGWFPLGSQREVHHLGNPPFPYPFARPAGDGRGVSPPPDPSLGPSSPPDPADPNWARGVATSPYTRVFGDQLWGNWIWANAKANQDKQSCDVRG